MLCIEVALVFLALAQNATGALEQVTRARLRRLWRPGELTLDFVLYAAHACAQEANGSMHALELSGAGVTPDLGCQHWRHAVVVLT